MTSVNGDDALKTELTNPIRVVLVADQNYVLPATVCVRSLLDSAAAGDVLEVIFLARGFSAADSRNFYDSLEPGRHHVLLVNFELALASHAPTRVHKNMPDITYMRLMLDRFLPKEWDRCIYIDPDTLVRGSLRELFENSELSVIAAVPDPWTPLISSLNGVQEWQALSLDPAGRYFNAGVLLLSLAEWRLGNWTQRCEAFVEQYRESIVQYDQEVLNALLGDSVTILTPEWNTTSYWQTESFLNFWSPDRLGADHSDILMSSVIRHFEGPIKPWTTAPTTWPHVQEYFDVVDRTKWSGFRPVHHLTDLASPSAR